QQISLNRLEARLLGGGAGGDAVIANWQEQKPGQFARNAGQQKGSVRLRLKDISAGAVANALATRAHPLQRANLVATANGTLELRWTGSPKSAEAEVAVNLTAPAVSGENAMPVNGSVRATYRAASDELEIAQLEAASRASEVHASGRFAS